MKKILPALVLLISTSLYSQNLSFKKEAYNWPNAAPNLSEMTTEFSEKDAVIINEDVKFNLLNTSLQVLTKNCIVKINNEKGAKQFKSLTLPESFDLGADKYSYQQGRQQKTQTPFIYNFKIIHFAARVLKKSGKVIDLPMDVNCNNVFWLEGNGNRLEDFNYIFSFANIEVGDVIEYNYRIDFAGRYGYNLFFFNGEIAKQNSTFQIKYSPVPFFDNFKLVYNANGADSSLKTSFIVEKTKTIWTYDYRFKNLKSNNCPVNSCSGKNLPYVFVDISFINSLGYSTAVPAIASLYVERSANFEWFGIRNLYEEPANYDRQHANIRKFLNSLSHYKNNPDKSIYFSKLCDTINTLKFVSAESMNNGDDSQYAVGSGEWLLKGKIIEEFMFEIYDQLLTESKTPNYMLNVQNKRLGEHTTNNRTAYKYEFNLFGVDNGKSISYIMPRVGGLKYNFREIPFYYEGVLGALINLSYHGDSAKPIQFIKIPSSSEDENIRTENGVFNFNLDSKIISATTKESLNGQFSTILRSLYLKETIDSTVHPLYFKKCSDKPNAQNVTIKKTSSSTSFPFKNSFSCSEEIVFDDPKEISLKNWFSFTFDNKRVTEKPNFDYYFDFQYSDVYNFMLEFNKPIEVLNMDDFSKSMQNTYFELTSKLIKQSETSYLISVTAKVKEPILKLADGQLLLDFVDELEKLNNLTLKIKEKQLTTSNNPVLLEPENKSTN